MLLLLKLILRSLVNQKRFCWFFLINSVIGLLGLVLVESFNTSLSNYLQLGSKKMMGADLYVGARRALTKDEQKSIEQSLKTQVAWSKKTSVIEIYTMAASAKSERLVQLRAINPQFPFYGELGLNGGTESRRKIFDGDFLWVYPELLTQLNIKLGDTLKIGTKRLVVTSVVDKDIGMSIQGFSLAPRIYLSEQNLKKTELLLKGSMARYRTYYKLPPGADTQKMAREFNRLLPDPGIRVADYRNFGQDNGKMMKYVLDYLGLVALVALGLSALALAYLFKRMVLEQARDSALLSILGFSLLKMRLVIVGQLIVLGLLGTCLAIGLGSLLIPVVSQLVELDQQNITFELTRAFYLKMLTIGIMTPLVACWPLLASFSRLSPTHFLFQKSRESLPFQWRDLLALIPTLALSFALAFWQSQSFVVALIFCLLFAVASAFFALCGHLLLLLFQSEKLGLSLKLSIRGLARQRSMALACFLALGLGRFWSI